MCVRHAEGSSAHKARYRMRGVSVHGMYDGRKGDSETETASKAQGVLEGFA